MGNTQGNEFETGKKTFPREQEAKMAREDLCNMSEKVSSLIGVLVDVSGSMQSSIGGGVHEEGGEWARSVFRVIDSLITHDVSDSNRMFAFGVGAKRGHDIFDVIRTLENCECHEERSQRSFESTIDRILDILQNAGAASVRKWATFSVIREVVSHRLATLVLHQLESKPDFVRHVVNACLPSACKGVQNNFKEITGGYALPGPVDWVLGGGGEYILSTLRPARKKDIEDAVEKAMAYLLIKVSIPDSILTVKNASKILHGSVDENDLTKERVQELMDTVRFIIYGLTPLWRSLENASKLFSRRENKDHKKLLFVLSDGMPTDSFKHDCIQKLKQADVTIVCCFITKSTNIIEPKRLFSRANSNWEDGAKLLFELSSKIPTELLPRTIFIKQGWKIDITDNETKLFLQVNHPDILKNACDLARNVVCCQDALADVLTSVSLDIYINQSRKNFGAKEQEEGTCYANASAAVLHLSMKRILGRQGGYPEFDELRQELIDEYGENGANTFLVLQNVCSRYRLQCKQVDALGAMAAITAKRPVVARFRLTDNEWSIFSRFFKLKPTGILTCKDLNITKRPADVKTGGHAVVLTSYNSECMRLMNSWGFNWGDNGFFRVQNAHVLGLDFIDVFWTEDQLKPEEREYYAKHGAGEAAKFLQNLKGLQVLKHQCPRCKQMSNVTEFTGQIWSAKCPRCNRRFKCDEPGNILALNMYLTSLSQ